MRATTTGHTIGTDKAGTANKKTTMEGLRRSTMKSRADIEESGKSLEGTRRSAAMSKRMKDTMMTTMMNEGEA